MTMRPCLDCGEPSTASRCDEHRRADLRQRQGERDKTSPHWNRNRWKKLSIRLRRMSPFCELCGSTTQLQIDHIIPVSERPDLTFVVENLRVLCARCNGARKNRVTETERAGVEARIAAKKRRRVALTTQGDEPSGTASPSWHKAQTPLHTPGGYGC